MRKMKKMIIIILTVFLTIVIFNSEVLASNFDFTAFDNDVPEAANAINLVNDTAVTAIGIARVVCMTIAIVMLLVIAMKYMISAPGDRADIKKHAVHYVIGAFILFAVTGILSIIDSFAKAI